MADNQSEHDDDRLPPVTFSFATFSGWEADDWKVRAFELREEVHRPYVLELQVITDDVDVDDAALMGAECELVLDRGGVTRSVPGIIRSVRSEAVGRDRLGLRLVIGPALALLALCKRHRTFTEMSVVDVAVAVLGDFLAHYGRDVELALDPAAYRPRHTITQRGESDLEFIEALLADEGIYYHFTAEGGRERVVLADMSQQAPRLTFADEGDALTVVSRGSGAAARESVSTFSVERALTPTSALSRYWSHEEADQVPAEAARGDVDEPGARTIEECSAPDPRGPGEAERRARLCHEASQAEAARASATTDAIALACGARFGLSGHPQRGCDRGWFITAVVHCGDAPDIQTHGDADARPRYENKVVCIPDTTPYRPPRTPAAAAHLRPCPQTAIVVGPEGEEIHTDEFGRILVRFAWDRGEGHTFWVRVLQPWAGAGFGCQFIPRIGTEVMVEYLNGDPDQPVVIGCLHNSQHPYPFALPERKAVSGVRSDSTPGGGGCNELVLDDTKGQEALRLFTVGDLCETAERDYVRCVGGNQTITVQGSIKQVIKKAHSRTVEGQDVLLVTQNRFVCVENGVKHEITGGDLETTVHAGAVTTHAETGAKVTTNGNMLTEAKGSIAAVSAEGNLLLCGQAGRAALLGYEAAVVRSDAGPLNLNGMNDVSLDSTIGATRVAALKEVVVESITDVLALRAQKGVVAKTPGQVSITAGEDVAIVATQSITFTVGMSSIKITPQGITLSGPLITSTATGVHTISGSMIVIN